MTTLQDREEQPPVQQSLVDDSHQGLVNMFPAFLGGTIGGAVGAAIRAAIAYFTNLESGWIAWAIGGLVGFGVALGHGGEGSRAAGMLAAVLAVLAIAVGRYVTVQLLLPDVDEIVAEYGTNLEDEELIVSYVADAVAEEFEEAGRELAWSEMEDGAMPSTRVDYPPAVWEAAALRWDSMTPQDRDACRSVILEGVAGNAMAFRSVIGETAFRESVSPIDVVFVGLALFTAFRIASGGVSAQEQLAPVDVTDSDGDAAGRG